MTKILCDAAPPIAVDPISAADVAPQSASSPSHSCSQNDPELCVAAGIALKAAHLGAGVPGYTLAVVMVRKTLHSDIYHQNCFVESDASNVVSRMKLEAMLYAKALVQMQVGDD